MPLRSGLPTVAVYDAVIHPRDSELVIGTHGRSVWVLDISPLEQVTPEVLAEPVHLFDIKPVDRFQIDGVHDWQFMAQSVFDGANPAFGAVIDYYLQSNLGENVEVRIADKADYPVATLQGPGYAGLQEVVWDLRRSSTTAPPGSDFITPAAETYFSDSYRLGNTP